MPYVLPPDPNKDPVEAEVRAIQAQNGRVAPPENGRFLPPGQLSRKAKAAGQAQPRASRELLEADMLGAELPPPVLPSEPPSEAEEMRARHRDEWRARKQPLAEGIVAPDPAPPSADPELAVSPFSPQVRAPEPSALSGACPDAVFLRLQQRRILLECTLQGPHPNQPHMHNLAPVEDGDIVFIGWWHQGE
jgi:hypothetical protein